MIHFSPRTVVALMVALAAGVLVGGWMVSRREAVVRHPVPSAPEEVFARGLHEEVARLERLYESHLGALAQAPWPVDEFELRTAGEAIEGVRQVSVLEAEGGNRAAHVEIRLGGEERPFRTRVPKPVFQSGSAPLGDPEIPLGEAFVAETAGRTEGWIEGVGGNGPLFWMRRDDGRHGFVLVDAAEVGPAMATAVDGWARAGPWETLHASGHGTYRWERSVVGSPGTAEPDRVWPVPSRFRDWQLEAWDRRETVVSRHRPTLAAAGGLALVLVGVGASLSYQQRRAQREAERRVSFVNRVSHELRSPLTNILLNVDLGTEALNGSPAAAAVRNRLRLVREEGQRLARLIDNVLTFSRHEQGSLTVGGSECEPDEVVRKVLDQFRPLFDRRHIEVDLAVTGAGIPRQVDGDALAQIVANLFSNVEKYAGEGAHADVAVTLSDGRLKVAVADDGRGVPAGDAERIFLPFARRGGRTDDGVTGTGLGLTISRELASQMGGSLALDPDADKTRFVLDLPAPEVARRPPEA